MGALGAQRAAPVDLGRILWEHLPAPQSGSAPAPRSSGREGVLASVTAAASPGEVCTSCLLSLSHMRTHTHTHRVRTHTLTYTHSTYTTDTHTHPLPWDALHLTCVAASPGEQGRHTCSHRPLTPLELEEAMCTLCAPQLHSPKPTARLGTSEEVSAENLLPKEPETLPPASTYRELCTLCRGLS